MRKWRSICSSRTRMINGQGCSNNNKSIAVIYFVLPQQHLEILSSSVRAGWVIWYPRRKGENGRTESPRKGIWPSFLHKLHGTGSEKMMTTRREFFRSHFLAIPRSFAGELLFYLPICEEGQREGLWESNGQEE